MNQSIQQYNELRANSSSQHDNLAQQQSELNLQYLNEKQIREETQKLLEAEKANLSQYVAKLEELEQQIRESEQRTLMAENSAKILEEQLHAYDVKIRLSNVNLLLCRERDELKHAREQLLEESNQLEDVKQQLQQLQEEFAVQSHDMDKIKEDFKNKVSALAQEKKQLQEYIAQTEEQNESNSSRLESELEAKENSFQQASKANTQLRGQIDELSASLRYCTKQSVCPQLTKILQGTERRCCCQRCRVDSHHGE